MGEKQNLSQIQIVMWRQCGECYAFDFLTIFFMLYIIALAKQ